MTSPKELMYKQFLTDAEKITLEKPKETLEHENQFRETTKSKLAE